MFLRCRASTGGRGLSALPLGEVITVAGVAGLTRARERSAERTVPGRSSPTAACRPSCLYIVVASSSS